jgi:hypothetical protein
LWNWVFLARVARDSIQFVATLKSGKEFKQAAHQFTPPHFAPTALDSARAGC